jgi:hypothetical protein
VLADGLEIAYELVGEGPPLVDRQPQDAALPSIAVPTLLIWGSRDPAILWSA